MPFVSAVYPGTVKRAKLEAFFNSRSPRLQTAERSVFRALHTTWLEEGTICYRARVTLSHDVVIHTRPANWIAHPLQDLDASVHFHRDDMSANIWMDLALVDVMQAAADLNLTSGCTFELTCRGADARKAYRALRESLTTSYFEGSEFVPLKVPEEMEDV